MFAMVIHGSDSGRWPTAELAKKPPDAVWRTDKKLLEALAKVATEREGSRSRETAVR